MDNVLSQLGIGAIFVILVLRMIFEFLGKKKNGNQRCIMASKEFNDFKDEMRGVKEKIIHLDDAHSRYDEDGIPLWYVPRGWADVQARMVDTLVKIDQNQRAIADTLKRIEEKV